MNRLAILLLTLGVSLAVMLGGCSAKPSADPAKPSAITAYKPPPEPELWLDKEAADMVKAILDYNLPGYSQPDEVYVIRWKNCEHVHGWVKLDAKGGSESALCDLTILPKDIPANNGNGVFKPRDFGLSGWVVVTMRHLPNTPGEAYDVRVEQGYTEQYANVPVDGHIQHSDGISSTMSRRPTCRGTLLRIPPDADPKKSSPLVVYRFSNDNVVLQKFHDGRTVSWLELRVGPATSESEAKADPSPPPKPSAKAVSSGESSSSAR